MTSNHWLRWASRAGSLASTRAFACISKCNTRCYYWCLLVSDVLSNYCLRYVLFHRAFERDSNYGKEQCIQFNIYVIFKMKHHTGFPRLRIRCLTVKIFAIFPFFSRIFTWFRAIGISKFNCGYSLLSIYIVGNCRHWCGAAASADSEFRPERWVPRSAGVRLSNVECWPLESRDRMRRRI